MSKKSPEKGTAFPDLVRTTPPSVSLGFGRDKARKILKVKLAEEAKDVALKTKAALEAELLNAEKESNETVQP